MPKTSPIRSPVSAATRIAATDAGCCSSCCFSALASAPSSDDDSTRSRASTRARSMPWQGLECCGRLKQVKKPRRECQQPVALMGRLSARYGRASRRRSCACSIPAQESGWPSIGSLPRCADSSVPSLYAPVRTHRRTGVARHNRRRFLSLSPAFERVGFPCPDAH